MKSIIEFKNKIYKGSNGRQSLFDCCIPENAKAVIIFAHGYKGYKDWGAWQLMEDFFLNRDYGFVKFNFSHNGGTVENPIDFPDLNAFGENRYSYELNDLDIITTEIKRIIVQECEMDIPLYLLGHSRGGGVVILGGGRNEAVDKIISLAGISNIASRFPKGDDLLKWEFDGVMYVENGRTKQAMPHFYSFYEDFIAHQKELDIEAAAKTLEIPFLQVHGDMDLAVSISEGINVADWTETRLGIVKGAGHTFSAKHPWESNEMPEDMKRALAICLEFFES